MMTDPFDVLGFPPVYTLDLKVLEKQHRELSRALHPDKYVSAGAAERQMALGKAADVNEAARALRDPIRRAEALFARAGVPTGETSEPKLSPAFLMDILEEREALSEASDKGDRAAIEKLGATIKGRADAVDKALGKGFAGGASGDAGATDATTLTALLPRLGELRFYRRFLDEVRLQLDKLDDAAS